MVVVEDAQRLDHVGDRDPAVEDEKQVFPVAVGTTAGRSNRDLGQGPMNSQ